MDPNAIVPGTGQTVGDLLNAGYSQSDIQGLMGDATAYGAPISTDGSSGGGGGNVSISSLSTLFSNLATSAASIYKTVTGPSTNVINPRTGQPYTQAQLTALAQQNAALGPAGNISGILPILFVGLLIFVLIGRK